MAGLFEIPVKLYLGAAITDSDTDLDLVTGGGDRAGENFPIDATIEDGTNTEAITIDSKAGDTITVTRGGTSYAFDPADGPVTISYTVGLKWPDYDGQLATLDDVGGGAPDSAEYVVLAASGSLTSERVLTEGDGVTFTDAGAGAALTVDAWSTWAESVRLPAGFHSANATSNLSPTSGTSYAFYLGRADRALTQAIVQWLHTVNSASITWAELAICSGALSPGSGATLTVRGYTDVSGPITSGAPAGHTTTITLSGIAAGADLWLVYGISATTPGSLRAGNLPDVIGAGFVQTASVRPQSISSTAFSVASSTNQFWAATGLS